MLLLSKHILLNEGVLAIQHIYKNLRPFISKQHIAKISYSNKNSYSKTLFLLHTNTCMQAPVIDSKPPYKVLISIAELGCTQALAHFLECTTPDQNSRQQLPCRLQLLSSQRAVTGTSSSSSAGPGSQVGRELSPAYPAQLNLPSYLGIDKNTQTERSS